MNTFLMHPKSDQVIEVTDPAVYLSQGWQVVDADVDADVDEDPVDPLED